MSLGTLGVSLGMLPTGAQQPCAVSMPCKRTGLTSVSTCVSPMPSMRDRPKSLQAGTGQGRQGRRGRSSIKVMQCSLVPCCIAASLQAVHS